MGKGNRAYKSAKRQKELKRKQKQEEKLLKRLGKKSRPEEQEVETEKKQAQES